MTIPIKNIIFIDIETVSDMEHFDELNDVFKNEWHRKAQYVKPKKEEEETDANLYAQKAGIYAEFGKIICIGLGAMIQENGAWKLALKSIAHHDEKLLLENFLQALQQFAKDKNEIFFCGHNIKEFDLPYICRRLLIHEMPLPSCLQLSHKKPWEIKHVDTLELWRFGDYKHYITLALLAACLGLPTPKDDINGAMVNDVYWQEKDLDRIATYCLKDVATTAKVYFKLSYQQFEPLEIKML